MNMAEQSDQERIPPPLTRQGQPAAGEKTIRRIITAGLLLAVTLLLAFTPVGFIPVPTPAGSATIAHIPAIIGGVLEGPWVGAIVGLGFGLGSFFSPAVPIKDPLVIILPRLFIGIAAALAFALLRRANKPILTVVLAFLLVFMLAASYEVSKRILWVGILAALVSVAVAVLLYLWLRREDVLVFSLAVVGVVGSLTNTVLVLSAAVWRGYVTAPVAWGIALTQGIPEAIVSAIVVVAVVSALHEIGPRRRGSRL
jgi:uncharacterized membrane protein